MIFSRKKNGPEAAVAANAPTEATSQATSKATSSPHNNYGFTLSKTQIEAGAHRKRVGAMWDEIGKLQFDYLVERGLKPEMRLLDIGCGALRGGLHFVRYLEPAHYYGNDINESLLQAGLEHEIPDAGLTDKLPASNLRTTETFECDFGVSFDFALAQSVFSHLPLNHIRLCLFQLSKATEPGARFLATFFEAPEDLPLDQTVRQPKVTTRTERDPFHYRPSDLEWAAGSAGGWTFNHIGDWSHPRGQKMAEFVRN